MQPDSISSLPNVPLPAWHRAAPVLWLGRHYTTSELYSEGLAGHPMAEAAESLKVPPPDLRALLKAHPIFVAAYEDGWADWESESLRRSEVALARSAEGYTVKVKKVKVEKGVATRYEEEEHFPPAPTSLAFRLERRDRPRFGKDVREEAPSVGQQVLERVSLYLVERGLGAVQGLPASHAGGDE